MRAAFLAMAGAAGLTTSAYETATVDWVAADYSGTGDWTDRRSGKVFAMGTTPPTWNPILKSFDFDGVNDYLETPDHADLNFANLQDHTIAVVLESLTPGQTAKAILSKKNSYVNTTAGWALRTNATGLFEYIASDATTQVASGTLAMPTVAATVGYRIASDVGRTFVETTESGNSSMTTVGNLDNTRPVRLGAVSAPTPANFGAFRIFRVTIWRTAI